MLENLVKKKLASGGVSVGTFLAFESTLSVEIMARAGFDWLMIDTEHGPITDGAATNMLLACRAAQATPFLRVVWNESSLIQQALDLGAYGVLIPVIDTRAQAEAAVQDAKYPPVGQRSCGGMRGPIAFATDMGVYRPRANDETLLMVQVETKESAAAADQVAAVEGIDVLFVGPNDLAISFDEWPLNWAKASAAYKEAIASIPRIAKKHGKYAGIQVYDPAFAADAIACGYQMIGFGGDSSYLAAAAKAGRAQVKV